MEEKTKLDQEKEQHIQDGLSSFDFSALYRTIILNWYWFIYH